MAKKTNNNTEQVVDIDTLRQDMHNFNRGTEEGQELMERSFKEMGAGQGGNQGGLRRGCGIAA